MQVQLTYGQLYLLIQNAENLEEVAVFLSVRDIFKYSLNMLQILIGKYLIDARRTKTGLIKALSKILFASWFK